MTSFNNVSNKLKKVEIALQKSQLLEEIVEELASRVNKIYTYIQSLQSSENETKGEVSGHNE